MVEENRSLQFRDLIHRNYTGIKNVYKNPNDSIKGYDWTYSVKINNKKHTFSSKSLKSLRHKALTRKLPWIIEEKERAKDLLKKDAEDNRKDPKFTGFWRVSRVKEPYHPYYGCWIYQFRTGEGDFRIYDEDLRQLKEKVKEKHYPWIVLDEETARKTVAENKNRINVYTSGIEHVMKLEDNWTPVGFTWIYYYWENDERKRFRKNNLIVLERKAKRENLPWIIFDEEAAKQSYEENEERLKLHHQKTTSGIYLVTKHKNEEMVQGFDWVYRYNENGENKPITSKNLYELEKKVKARKLPWIIIDDELAEENYKLYENSEK